MYVSRGAQTGIIKNSLPGLSLVIDDLMRRLISSIARDRVRLRPFFALVGRVSHADPGSAFLPRGDPAAHILSLKFINL